MSTSKTTKIIYWTSTSIIFLFEGVMPALTSHTDLAVEGIRHLGYPDYFRVMLTIFKVAGALALILPFVKGRFKEWAYAGFGFTIIAAFISHGVVDGLNGQTFFPLLIFAILTTSYLSYHKLSKLSQSDFKSVASSKYALSSLSS
ncbi:DoxX family protein [Adhaeribacter swui]|uniref:DoxX family protein n=1 Tax=Adhaeribacter swui TaxID=2086471 RepID=A0A7G7GED5_9BACT|nr:DoxX family protein [Adhaeribacter swui]QNF35519.1 DoxX family protein [Adhaeribacter swui]